MPRLDFKLPEEMKMKVTNNVYNVGVNDRDTTLFEGQYSVLSGMAYNSYLAVDEKVAVFDTVAEGFGEEWIGNIKSVLGERAPDYLIVLHMEPDHSANILKFTEIFPEAKIVSSAKSFAMMRGFFGNDFSDRQVVVGENSTLSLGERNITFLTAPMVHWPEVLVAYDGTDKILFSADGFGKFGTSDADEEWEEEARRYYIGIVGKYGTQVLNLLKKVAGLDIQIICSLHGPVLKENISHYIELYKTWASYTPEYDGTVIAYASVYSNTAKAAHTLAQILKDGGERVELFDLTTCDIHNAAAHAFAGSKLVLASITYNADIFPAMRAFIDALVERGYQNRKVAFIENGSWAPMAAKVMRARLEGAKNIAFAENGVKITSAMSAESEAQIKALADELMKK